MMDEGDDVRPGRLGLVGCIQAGHTSRFRLPCGLRFAICGYEYGTIWYDTVQNTR